MSTPILPHYSFLPWARRGNATLITDTENFGTTGSGDPLERAGITLKVKVKGNGTVQQTLTTDLKIIGPGDILGISKDVVVKTEPHNWITNFEPNYFAYIDFYEEDFPWRYTPAKESVSHQLRPWLTLVVLKEDEFTRETGLTDAPLNSFTLTEPDAENWPLPKYSETWAWAHVHVNDDIDPSDTGSLTTAMTNLNGRLNENGDIAISRIICPRKLEENTSYYAFLIPSFETGRLSGLGADAATIAALKAQTPSWGVADAHQDYTGIFPIYYEWYFRTGATGDFEYLVRQLMPRTVDERVGRRPMDIQDPGFDITYTDGTAPDEGTLALEGALRIPGNEGEAYPWPSSTDFRETLRDLINLGEDMTATTLGASGNYYAGTPVYVTDLDDDPIVAPPLYGRWHALKRTVDSSDDSWINELNLDPRNRVAASLGAEFVRKNQDLLMDQAWAQLGAVIEANKKIRWGQLALQGTQAMHDKHLAGQPAEQGLGMTARMHARILSGPTTLHEKIIQTRLPAVAKSTIFRKLRRPDGPIMKRIDPAQASFTQAVGLMATGVLKGAQTKQAPTSAQLVDTTILNATLADSLGLNTSGYLFKTAAPGVTATASNNFEAIGFQSALQDFSDVFQNTNWATPSTPSALSMASTASEAVTALFPAVSLPKRVWKAVQFIQGGVEVLPPMPDKIVPALAAPSMRQPLYRSLRDLGPDYFIPNLDLVPQNTLTLLETNQKFIESFMVGANYEMGRELLWREYPTDQRGTYFKHFWENTDLVNVDGLSEKDFEEQVQDIGNIHEWLSTSDLGSHNARIAGGAEATLTLLIRGDLLKKFPNAVIFAVEAEWQLQEDGITPDKTVHRLMKENGELYPVFGAKVEPDLTFIGFDLTAEDAIGDEEVDDKPGWFFVIMERPGEPRFGVDISSAGTLGSWNDLAFDDITVTASGYIDISATVTPTDNAIPPASSNHVPWGSNAANMAMILYQNPVLVAIHAKEMLPATV